MILAGHRSEYRAFVVEHVGGLEQVAHAAHDRKHPAGSEGHFGEPDFVLLPLFAQHPRCASEVFQMYDFNGCTVRAQVEHHPSGGSIIGRQQCCAECPQFGL